MTVIKILDDILMTGADEELRGFCKRFHDIYILGSIYCGPGHLQFNSLNII